MPQPRSQRAHVPRRVRTRAGWAGLGIIVVAMTGLNGCAAGAETHVPETNSPAFPDSENADPGYLDPDYSEPDYSEPDYSEPDYSEPDYSEPDYSDPGPTNPCAFPGDPLCPHTPITVPPPDLGPAGGW
jgi:hypothetical protein